MKASSWLIFFACLLGVVCCVGMMFGPSKPKAPIAGEPSQRFAADDFWRLTHPVPFNSKAAEAFKDITVELSGMVESWQTERGKTWFKFSAPQKTVGLIECHFDQVEQIEAGQSITIIGVCEGKANWAGTVVIRHCRKP